MEKNEEIIYIIRKMMRSNKKNHRKMGELLGITRETFCNKMNLHYPFTLEEIIKICDYLGLEITIKRKDENHDKT